MTLPAMRFDPSRFDLTPDEEDRVAARLAPFLDHVLDHHRAGAALRAALRLPDVDVEVECVDVVGNGASLRVVINDYVLPVVRPVDVGLVELRGRMVYRPDALLDQDIIFGNA